MLIGFILGFIVGYVVSGWLKKSPDNTYPYPTYTETLIDVDQEFLGDKPRYFGRPIRVENTEPNFEQVWLNENKYKNYLASKSLSDDDYIKYHQWEKENWEEMRAKHTPNACVIRGSNDHVIFHGGCLSCQSQQLHGIDRCKGCQYFKANWNLPDLSTNRY